MKFINRGKTDVKFRTQCIFGHVRSHGMCQMLALYPAWLEVLIEETIISAEKRTIAATSF